jgi:hypothetical protein
LDAYHDGKVESSSHSGLPLTANALKFSKYIPDPIGTWPNKCPAKTARNARTKTLLPFFIKEENFPGRQPRTRRAKRMPQAWEKAKQTVREFESRHLDFYNH